MEITEAAHAARTHTVFKFFAYGGHVGGHFWKKVAHIILLYNRQCVRNLVQKEQHLILAAMLAAILGEKVAHIILLQQR